MQVWTTTTWHGFMIKNNKNEKNTGKLFKLLPNGNICFGISVYSYKVYMNENKIKFYF